MTHTKFELPIRYESINRGYKIVDFNGVEIGRFLQESDAINYVNLVNGDPQ